MQRRRDEAVPHRQHHLDHARHTRRRLRVPQVRLHRAQQQRFVPVPPPPVRRQQRLRLDRITQRGARTVRLHHVHIHRRQPRRRQRRPDHPLLRRTVRRRQPVRRPVLVHRRTPDHGENAVAEPARVGEPFQEQHADALGPARTVGALGERLAPPVGGEAALPAEVDERLQGGHHGHPAGQGQGALAGTQRLHGQVQRDQRRRAGGVEGEGRPLEAEGVGDPAGEHAAGGAAADEAVQGFRDLAEPGGVVVVHHAGEHADPVAAQRERVDPGVLDGLPGRLQHEPLLGVHGQRLVRGDLEQLRVEVPGVVQEPALPGVGAAAPLPRRVVRPVGVPAPVDGESGDAVAGGGHQVPQLLR
ncbi:hypothetical protein B0E53_06491 [Micromonospora sp. MH33]|nr:hypothetical protein B0E53_06491 [Micromonospora sp. MH33]